MKTANQRNRPLTMINTILDRGNAPTIEELQQIEKALEESKQVPFRETYTKNPGRTPPRQTITVEWTGLILIWN